MIDISFWDTCLKYFEKTLPSQQFNSWIKPLAISSEGENIIIFAPNSFILKLVQDRFLVEIKNQAQQLNPNILEVIFKIQEIKTVSTLNVKPEAKIEKQPEKSSTQNTKLKHETKFSNLGKLNPNLCFDNFIVGKANQLAFAASQQVAETPGTSYNPLFIYGGVGLGKTHLIQALGNKVKESRPDAKICYMHAEKYVSDVVRAYQTNKFEEFKQFYHSLDILLIDDIQFFAGKSKTQEEFFYAFNTLLDSHKQVIMTSDTFPKEITGLDSRLVSRFGWGLTVAIDPPELEMRVAILLNKASLNGYALNESVAFFIAKHVNSNIRELEGALKRVEAYVKFHRQPISVETAKEALKDIIIVINRQITVENIQKTVAEYYRIKISDMLSKKRNRNLTRPRQIAMSISRELTSLSLPEIGNSFGGKDHTTVIHACKLVQTLRESDTTINDDYKVLLQTIKG
jgi:chromosomal replication initiator protein